MQRTHYANARQPLLVHTLFALGVVIWLAVGQASPTLGVEPVSRTALTLTLSQRERGPAVATLSQRERGPWDKPNCRLEERFFTDAADGRLNECSPFAAALIASGVENADSLHHYERKAASLADELRHSGQVAGTPREQVVVIFEFLHHRILHGEYDLAYTDLRRVLDDGRYNCVSATVLFNYLAGQFGLDCRALEMPGHAMSRVALPAGPLDIETTYPRWFRMKDEPKQYSASTTKTIGTAVRADRSKAREVSPIQLAAMIYYNRGVDLLAEKRYANAAAANAKALRLDPTNANAQGNLLATMNNWSIDLGNSKHFAEAVDLLRQGLAMDPKFAAFAQNYVHVHRQWVDHLCREGRFREAIDILSRAAAEMPDRDYLRRAQSEVRARWAKAAAM